ncbi:MAG: ABC transporter substrate-binding protein, partial [Cellvibrionaceae bacterium]|nr:ABC transporter substrate-binding protein [Cellvibrionaceae bacterium]
PCQLFAGEVEVLHWWAEGSEAAAIGELRHLVEQQGHHWKDFAVEGGAGVSAMAVLKIRAISGNPPTTAQLKGTNIAEWASLGFLSELDDIATEQQWDKALPPIIAKDMKYNGHYVAVPVNIHRVNWLWINPRIFEKAGATIPTTLDELLEAAQTIKAAGYTAIAHGGERWQDATVFESIALAFLGAKQYHKAFVEHDPQVLSGQAMIDALTYFKKLN